MNEQDLINKVQKVYGNFDSYCDEGTFVSDGPESDLQFQTYFVRPGKFHFRWVRSYSAKTPKQQEESIIWSDGTIFKERYRGKTTKAKNFSLMIAGATGVSSSSVHLILNILISPPVEMRNEWQKMTNINFMPEELVNDFECFHLIGTNQHAEDTEVWIEKNTFFVRRLQEKNVMTEADCFQLNAEMQTKQNRKTLIKAVKKARPSSETIENALSLLALGTQPSSSYSIYNYNIVKINQPIDDALFTAGKTTAQ